MSRYTVRYQFGTYSGTHVVLAEDDDLAIALTRAWARRSSSLTMAYESYRIIKEEPCTSND